MKNKKFTDIKVEVVIRISLPVSGKASMNIIISSPLKPDKKHIRGTDLSICRAQNAKNMH